MNAKLAIAFIFFCFSFIKQGSAQQHEDKVAPYQSETWKNLLHYRWHWYMQKRSEADSKTFFFAPDGKKNLQHEWEATVQAFQSPWGEEKDWDQHAVCRFPARYTFYRRYHTNSENLLSRCQQFKQYMNRIDAKSVSLVFSSYFLDTPASTFGHTLLRFRKSKEDRAGYELLDYATNYSANATTSNAFAYAILGLFGGFDGEFASIPYFYKVREYNDYESRDLWDYQLNLTQEEIDMVLAHIWEMKQARFDYFYFTENCSYHMMGLLDVANPNWRLTERTPYFAIPIDTVVVAAQTPNLVSKVTFRPSKKRELIARLEKLTPEEKEFIRQLGKKNYDVNLVDQWEKDHALSAEKKALILDAAMDHIDYFLAKEILLEKSAASQTKEKLLIARGKTGVIGKDLSITLPENERPELGHYSSRITLAPTYWSESSHALMFEYRFALHDLIDPIPGNPKEAAMEMGRFQFQFFPKNDSYGGASKFRMEEMNLVYVNSLRPYDPFFPGVSWKAYVGSHTTHDNFCRDCSVAMAKLFGGMAYQASSFLVSAFLGNMVEIDPLDHRKLGHRGGRLSVGTEGQVIWTPHWKFNLNWEGGYYRNFLVHGDKNFYQWTTTLSYYPSMNWGVRPFFKRFELEDQIGISLLWYK